MMKQMLLVLVALFVLTGAALAAVNLNAASKEELESVKGIGPVKAQAVIEYRRKNGPFKSVDDLKNISGFGDKTVAAMRTELTVGGVAPAGTGRKATSKSEPTKDGKKTEKTH